MYLKRLEIQGFKSFAGRSVFEFGPGITAVIGPNGSGKSNLADALRWVLGEQNPRVLRSRRAEEIIFAGDRKRPPAGFAEVSIALDNASGWLPVAFDEVIFTRRLHRSGDSDYLVNRARVRRRDVLDLLSRAQVGQNSYAIMGQGLVDQVLNLPPLERRALIEEAADVRHLRLKIVDAVDRLSATRDNLDRVDLLVGEIAPRLAQLEVQAQRAREFTGLTDQLADTLHDLFARQWQERTAALVAARGAYEHRMTKLIAVQAAVEQLDVELAGVRTELQDVREAAARGESSLRELDDQVRRGEQRLELLGERRRLLVARLAELAADLEALRRERAELVAARQADETDTEDAAEADVVTARLDLELGRSQAALDTALRDLAAAEDTLRQARGQSSASEDKTSLAQRELHQLSREREEAIGRRNTLLARLRTVGADTLTFRTELRAIEHEIAARTGDQAILRRQTTNTRQLVEQAEKALQETVRELDAQRSRLELIARLREQQQGSDAGVRALVEGARKAGATTPLRLLALVSQVIRVQKGLETAIDAALGEHINAVLVPDHNDLQAAVRLLGETRAGRASIVPLKDLKPVHAVNLSGERGVLGVASRFVKCEGRYRELVDTLLGRVIVVEDGTAAQTMLRRGLGIVVTLDGTIYRPTGIVTAGHAGTGALALEYERELGELPDRIAALRAEQASRTDECQRLREQGRAADTRQRELDRRLDELQARRRRTQDDLANSRSRIPGLRGEAGWLRGVNTSANDRRAGIERDLAAASDEKGRLLHSVRAAQLAVEEARRRADLLRRPVEDGRARRSALIGALAVREQQQQARERLLLSRRAALERTERTLIARGAGVEEGRRELEAVDREKQELDRRLCAERARLGEVREMLRPHRERIATLAQREREAYESQAGQRTNLIQLERASMEAEVAVSRRAQAIDRLREEMEAEGLEAPAEGLEGAERENGAASLQSATPRGADALAKTATDGIAVTFETLAARARGLRSRIRQLGAVNAQAQADYEEALERHTFLTSQVADLQAAETTLQGALDELRHFVRDRFRETFQSVGADFTRYFKLFFGGGSARLALTEPEDYSESGVDILAQPPGKRQQHLQLLSGGERSMSAVALLFALLEANPAPFCVLDEVDAALDEVNVARFSSALQGLAEQTQFVLITHNRNTIQVADVVYGISMSGDGVSSVLSLRLETSDGQPAASVP